MGVQFSLSNEREKLSNRDSVALIIAARVVHGQLKRGKYFKVVLMTSQAPMGDLDKILRIMEIEGWGEESGCRRWNGRHAAKRLPGQERSAGRYC